MAETETKTEKKTTTTTTTETQSKGSKDDIKKMEAALKDLNLSMEDEPRILREIVFLKIEVANIAKNQILSEIRVIRYAIAILCFIIIAAIVVMCKIPGPT